MRLEDVKRIVYTAIADLVKVESTARMRSRTLRRDLVVEIDIGAPGEPALILLHLPYYWAEFAHDGRNEISGKLMVFFPNASDDPRTAYGTNYPRNPGDRLSMKMFPDEFAFFQRENRRRKAAGEDPIMVVTKHVKASEAELFFKEAWEQLVSSGAVDEIIAAGITHYLKEKFGTVDRQRGAAGL